MAVSDLLYEAGLLMLVGMIVVFIFLSILIFATKGLSKFAASIAPPAVAPSRDPKSSSSQSPDLDGPVVAAITAAVKQYKKNK